MCGFLPSPPLALITLLEAASCGLRRTHGRDFLDAEVRAEVFGFQMSPKSSRESEQLEPCKVATIVCNFHFYFY